jgi:hypothetical protein
VIYLKSTGVNCFGIAEYSGQASISPFSMLNMIFKYMSVLKSKRLIGRFKCRFVQQKVYVTLR